MQTIKYVALYKKEHLKVLSEILPASVLKDYENWSFSIKNEADKQVLDYYKAILVGGNGIV